jgi:hypothetical protein
MIFVAVWASFTGLGVWIYYDASGAAVRGDFPSGGLAFFVALLLSCRVGSTWIGTLWPGKGRSLKCVLWLLLSLFGWPLLEWHANSAARLAFQNPAVEFVRSYELAALEYLVFVFLWIAVMPGIEPPSSPGAKVRLPWKVLFLIAGLAIGGYGLWEARELFAASGRDSLDQFSLLQRLLVRAVLILYAFFMTRSLLPDTVSRLSGDSLD